MGQQTIIAWCKHTFNVAWGCTKVSEGCAHCYAESLSNRYGFSVWGKNGERRTFGEKHWREPLGWEAAAHGVGVRAQVFCSSMCDVFEDHPTIARERGKLWPLIQQTPNLDWLLLTKRPERIAECLPASWGGHGWPNVWLGTSIESEKHIGRADHLRQIHAVVRFVSAEPLLESIPSLNLDGIDWVIVGGESGPGYRPMNHAWAEHLRLRCAESGSAFFFKQSAAARTEMGIELGGKIVRAWPTPRVVKKARTGLFEAVR